ncbi:MAG: hypothetical protein WDW38_004324 [Sanguina aurantia]
MPPRQVTDTAAVLGRCFNTLRQLVGRSSVAFTETISLVAQPAGESQLRSMCDKLWALHNDMHPASCKAEQATALNLSWSDVNSGPSGAAGAARLLHEYQAFLVALSAAMMEGLRLLALLATAQEGPSANGPGPSIAFRYNAFHYLVFDVSWKVVCKSTLVKGMWPMDWPLHSAPPDHLYHTALDSLVSWLLLFNRGKSALWKEAQRQENADKAFRERLYYMLQPPVLHMQNISLLEGKERELAVAALPPAFVAKLCCVLCEGLRYRKGRSNAPLDLNGLHTVAHMVALMAMAVGRLVCSEHPTKAGAQTRALFSPAVIELARLALVACSKTDMQALSGMQRRAAGRRAPVTLLHLQSMTQMQMLMVTGLKSFRALGRDQVRGAVPWQPWRQLIWSASAEVKALAESRAADLGRKADALNAMREALLDLAKGCHGNERPECPIITRLAS